MAKSDEIRIRIEYEARGSDEACEPRDFLDCETEEEVRERVGEWAEESAVMAAYPHPDDIAALWAAVQKLREREG